MEVAAADSKNLCEGRDGKELVGAAVIEKRGNAGTEVVFGMRLLSHGARVCHIHSKFQKSILLVVLNIATMSLVVLQKNSRRDRDYILSAAGRRFLDGLF